MHHPVRPGRRPVVRAGPGRAGRRGFFVPGPRPTLRRRNARGTPGMTETAAAGPLHGVQVLDLTAVVLGPFATQTMGDWGADIVKVEPPDGDLLRNSGVARNRGMASVFLGANR